MKGKSKKVIAVSFVAIMVMMAFLGVVSAVTIEHHTMCKGMEDSIVTVHGSTGHAYSPVNETTEFYVTDSKAVCLVQIERINRGDTFRFEWYDPSDLLYQIDNSSTNPRFNCWFGIYSDGKTSYETQGYKILQAGTVDVSPPQLGWGTCWLSRSLKIEENPPANKIGNWHVDFYYNDEKQFTETFTISDSIPESGAPTSGRWIGTTSQGKDVAFIIGDTQVYNFTISYSFYCTGSRGSGTIKNNIPIDIVGNAFQDDSEMIYGEFTTSNSATGTFRKKWRVLYPYEDTCDSGNVTWSARRVQTMGDININEIMYNPPGADTDHEWLELYNNDTTDIDITGWRFYEAGTNHSLTLIQGSLVIPPEGYAIIADNATTFLDEHQECNCTVLDSVFSLNNSGEYIALKNTTLGIIDEVAYNVSWGADGNGRTLELNATGGWEESRVDGGTPCQQNSVLGVFEYTFEDFNDMITVTDTGFNDFSGNMGIVNKDGVPYIEAPLNISSLSQDEPGGSLRISYDFTKGDDEEAFAGIFMSLFGLTETQGTFDGETVEVIDFSNYTIDFKNIFAELQETPKDVEYVRFYVKGDPATEDKIILRVELKDNKGSTAYYRVSIPNINEGWQEVEIPIESFIGVDNVDLHYMKLLNFIIERNNYADNIHNPDKGTFYLDNIRFVDSDDSPKSLNEMRDDQFLDIISKRAFQYFLDWSSKDERSKGLISDRSTSNDLLTIGGTGFYLTAMPIGVERGWISREVARSKVKETLAILADDRLQGPERMGKIGYRGFFYHFLGIDGKRKINFDYPDTPENENLNTVELSTIDTALCLYGVLTCKEYFNGSHPDEMAIRDLADHIYKRVDWDFMLEPNSSQFYWGWKPNEERERDPYEIPDAGGLGCYFGTIEYPATVDYYTDEAYLISLLAIGSPDHPVSPNVYCSWIRETDGRDFVKSYPGSLFTYFFASLWINTEEWGTDACSSAVNWYENSQKAILSSHNHCIVNRNFSTYGENSWGLTACEGPDDAYRAYGARPCALNIKSQVGEDGTIAPYGAGSVITFGDEIANYSVLALKHYYQDTDLWRNRFGLGDAYNLDVSKVEGINGRDIIRNTGSWCNHVGFAIDNGPLLIAIENYRSGLIWDLIRKNKYISSALDKVYSIFTRECEYPDEYTVGCMIWRGGAHGSKVHGQFGCDGYSWSAKEGYVKYNTTELHSAEHIYLVLRYSKWSPSTTSIEIFLDEETNPRSSFIPENQGSWTNFAETDPIDLGKITEGTHTIKFSTEGQSYGVADLDKFTLSYLSK